MKIGILGTGMVGETLASKLVELGHDVMMGARSRDNKNALAWQKKAGKKAKAGTFADSAHFGELLMNCTSGAHSLEALRLIDAKDLAGKVLIDVANPLDGSRGMPPVLSICNTDSLGESIQREYPEARVVKTLNTVNCKVMVDPKRVPEDHAIFICGNDQDAKEAALKLLSEFGWKNPIDLGDITNSRATEQLMPIWIRLWGRFGTADFNFKIVKAAS
jgi:predicted dinucleotide-binding enzyme